MLGSVKDPLKLVIVSCLCRRNRYGSRTMNRRGLKPKPSLTPTLSRQAGEGVCPLAPLWGEGLG